MTENNRKINNSRQDRCGTLRSLRKKIILRAVFSVVTLLLTAVLLFSLTAAWYTNVADTEGLTFVAKQWDFEGDILIESGDVSIAPGDSGMICMQISNNGTETAAASVTVSKSDLSELMQKRLYFYVDTPFYRNAERMERVYVSDSSSYTYTVFPNSGINITETTQNAPPLKWVWVYDVLGYYVRGTVPDSGDAQIDEYLRPIEYDYDPFVTTFYEDGTLKTVDGIKTVNEFLREVSATDGYDGVIDPSKKTANGYYPVYLNSEGYGVWAYLCKEDEIEQNMSDDTNIGTSQDQETYPVKICVTGSNSRETAIEVGSKEMLVSALSTTSYASVKLTQDIALDESLMIQSGHRADIDLNGHTITSEADQIVVAEVGSKITLNNGTVQGNGSGYGVSSNGAEVVLNHIVMSGVEEGIKVIDHQNTMNADSRIHIVDSEIVGGEDALWIYGNNGDTDTKTTVIVERSTLVGKNYMGIICNGTYRETDIQLTDSTVKGYYTAIYHPQRDSVLQITNSTLEGITGIVVKGGVVNIENSTVRGVGTGSEITEPAYGVSGFKDTGDGIYLEANYEWDAEVHVSGSKTLVTSAAAEAVRKFEADAVGKTIVLNGGKYNTDVGAYLAPGATQTKTDDGYYTVNPS